MGLFKRKTQASVITYDPDTQKSVIKCSICNGEQVAGFKNKSTGDLFKIEYEYNGFRIIGNDVSPNFKSLSFWEGTEYTVFSFLLSWLKVIRSNEYNMTK